MQTILDLYDANRPPHAPHALDKLPADADVLYMKGKIRWKMGRKAEAMSSYASVVDLNPDSPAAIALAQARQIMNFYNKDLYNP